jgi:threonine dehydrogenase-like Zn-dependent dehydrogenase
MQAITLVGSELQFEADRQLPAPQTGEVLVDVLLAGVCETDLQLIQGYMGFAGVLGHEFVGVARSGQFAGQRVVGEINCSCHQCDTCRAGRPTHCPHRTVIGIDRHDGAFATTLAVPECNLHAVPDQLSNRQAVLTEPLAAAFEITEQVTVNASDRVAVLGDGRLALMCAQVLANRSSNVIVFGKHASKLQRFAERGVSTEQLQGAQPSDVPANAFDLVVDCTGSTTGLPMALHMVRPRGTVIMKTTVAGPHEQSLAAIVIDEINLLGSRCGPFDQALEAIANGQINLDDLVTDTFALSDYQAAFAAAKNADSFKVIFENA